MIDYVAPLATSDGTLPFSEQIKDIPANCTVRALQQNSDAKFFLY